MTDIPERLKRDEWFEGTDIEYYCADFTGWQLTVTVGDVGVSWMVETDPDGFSFNDRGNPADSIQSAYRAGLILAAATLRAMAAEADAELAKLDAS